MFEVRSPPTLLPLSPGNFAIRFGFRAMVICSGANTIEWTEESGEKGSTKRFEGSEHYGTYGLSCDMFRGGETREEHADYTPPTPRATRLRRGQ